jgi:hypothetical protein
MIDSDRKKAEGRIAIAAVVLALLLCGLAIALAQRKVAVEKKVEQNFATEQLMGKTAPEVPTRPDPDYR